MKLGMQVMTRGSMAAPGGMASVASTAERLGYDIAAVNDHLAVPRVIDSPYPYTDSGEWPGKVFGECFDVLTAIAYLAGVTDRLRLLSSVMVVPYRPALLTAKMLATADVLSAGRLIVGVGVGWMAEEFAAVGAPDFSERGRVTDEQLAAWKTLWTQDAPAHEGAHVRFSGISFEPKPVQKPHPPIWIGGESKAALRRTVAHADGWFPASNNPKRRLDTVARLAGGIAELRAMAEQAGRDPGSIEIAYIATWPVHWQAQSMPEGGRRLLTGAAPDLAADLAALARIGVSTTILTFQTPDLNETLDRMHRFAAEVMPLVAR